MNQLYTDSGPARGDSFYGREVLVQEILSGRQTACCVLGTRQVGKTSLLRRIEAGAPAIYLDIQWAGAELKNVVRQAAREIRTKRSKYAWLPDPNLLPKDDIFGVLEEVNDCAEAADVLIWLLIDEVEGLCDLELQNGGFLHRLRGTIQNCGALRTVLAAAKNIARLNQQTVEAGMSGFLNGMAIRYMAGLSAEETCQLLRQTRSATPTAVADDLAAHLFQKTNGHPLLLQLYGQRLLDDRQLRWPQASDFTHLLAKISVARFFDDDFDYLTDSERRILQDVASGRTMEFADFPDTLVEGLLNLGYLRWQQDRLAIGNDFLTAWLRTRATTATSQIPELHTRQIYHQSYFASARAVVIGVGTYQSPHLRDLPATVADADALARILADPGHCGYLPQHIHLFAGDQATLAAVRAGLWEVAQQTEKEATVIVYFSGHGAQVQGADGEPLTYLCLRDSDPADLRRTALSSVEFSELLAAIPARKLVVFVDACHAAGSTEVKGAGGATWQPGVAESFYDALSSGSGRVVIASSRASERSYLHSGGQLSLFTHHLCAALTGGAAVRGDGYVHVLDVFHYLSEHVRADTSLQTPILKAKDVDWNFPLALAQFDA